MTFIIVTILLLTDILFYATFIDVILSWFGVLGMNLRPAFLANILEPIYKRIKSIIPTNFGPFEFAPFIFMLILAFTQGVIGAYDIDAVEYYKSLINF